MGRQFDQLARLLSRRGSLVLPCSMLAMDFRVIEHRFRQWSARGQLGERFLILLEQGIRDREHLSGNAANHPPSANVGPPLLIITAFDRHQPLIECGNGLPCGLYGDWDSARTGQAVGECRDASRDETVDGACYRFPMSE
jgi:hypothetical protein